MGYTLYAYYHKCLQYFSSITKLINHTTTAPKREGKNLIKHHDTVLPTRKQFISYTWKTGDQAARCKMITILGKRLKSCKQFTNMKHWFKAFLYAATL